MFATNVGIPVFSTQNNAKRLHTVFNTGNSLISSSANFLYSRIAISSFSEFGDSFTGPDGIQYYLAAAKIQGSPAFGLNLVWIVPKLSYTAPAVTSLLLLLLVSIIACALVLTAVLGLVVAVLHSLHILISKLTKANSLDYDPSGGVPLFSEMRMATISFDKVMQKLTLFKSFIPAHILATIEDKDSTNDNDSILNKLSTKPTTRNKYSTELKLKKNDSKGSSATSISHSFTSSGSKMRLVGHTTDIQFSLGLQVKDITVLVVSIANFPQIFNVENKDQFVFLYKDLTDILQRAAKVNKGHLGVYESSHLVIGWNVLSLQQNQVQLAIACAGLILDGLEKLERKWSQTNVTNHIKSCLYIATRSSLVGNFGTDSLKKFTYFDGEIAAITKQMHMKNAKKWNATRLLIEQRVHEECKTTNYTRPLGTINHKTKKSQREQPEKPIIYELILGKSKQFENDEWMYELKQKNEFKTWEWYSNAFTLYKKGEYKEALKTFTELLEDTLQNDWHTQRMITKCSSKLKGIGNSTY